MLSDSQMAHLIDMVLVQQQEIVGLKASVLALLQIAQEEGLKDVQTRFQEYGARHIKEANIPGTLELIRALETLSRQLHGKTVN